MAHVYTPGLKVTEKTLVRKERCLPLKGEVIVQKGQKVGGEVIVARTSLPGNVTTVNLAGLLGVPAEDIKMMMLKQVNDTVKKDEMIAQSKGFLVCSRLRLNHQLTVRLKAHLRLPVR